MASSSSASSSFSGSTGSSSGKPIDPVTRNALRYSLSAREYKLLHRYLIAKSATVKKRAPGPARYERQVTGPDDYNAAAVRAALRVWIATFTGLKAWDLVSDRLFRPGKGQQVVEKAKVSFWKSDNVRLSSSLAAILLFHRLFHRFLLRLREALLHNKAKPFRQRNPRVARALTSKLTPAIGASLAGFFLGAYPPSQLRITIAIYVFSRALEFVYNHLEDRGWFKNRPWWFGSWLLMPAAAGQLLHAFVFDRDCFPAAYGNFIMARSGTYIKARPADYPKSLKWPGTYDIVDSLAEISRLRWPPFTSPILFPNTKNPLPSPVLSMSPITSSAHPSIKSLSCALLHPDDPSCLRTYITFWIRAFPSVARFFTVIFGAFSLLRWRAFVAEPIPAFNRLAKAIIRMSLFITGAMGTSWGSICFFQHFLPRGVLPTQRWFVGGFIGGLWAILERRSGRSNFLYSARLSLDSLWKVGVKHGWWRGIKNGDVLLFVVSLAVVNTIYERDPKAVGGGAVRKGLGMLRGEGWVDRATHEGETKEEERVLEERERKAQSVPLEEEDEEEMKSK